MEKCPKCGSERVYVNGVLQKKRGVMYYLGGQAAFDAGTRHSTKLMNAVHGKKDNAECAECHYTWQAGKGGAVVPEEKSALPEKPITVRETVEKTVRRCPKCGAQPEPGDVFCIQCGTKLNP